MGPALAGCLLTHVVCVDTGTVSQHVHSWEEYVQAMPVSHSDMLVSVCVCVCATCVCVLRVCVPAGAQGSVQAGPEHQEAAGL
jgi:hypothetical protein